jgi:lysophospholipase L1-like esterase
MRYATAFSSTCACAFGLFQSLAMAGLDAAPPARFIQRLQAGEKVSIATLGTSLTGGQWRWVDVMKEWLDADWPGQVTVHNLGVGASASSHPPGRSGRDMVKRAAAMQPDVVFIEFTTNDAYLPYHIPVAASKTNLESMISTLRAARPDVEIILQTMNACVDKPGSGNHGSDRLQLAAYCEGYREVARARGLRLVDHYPAWLKIATEDPARFDRLVPDRIHPQAAGYREVLLPALKQSVRGQAAGSTGP